MMRVIFYLGIDDQIEFIRYKYLCIKSHNKQLQNTTPA